MQPPDAKTIPDLLDDELAARYPGHEALVGGETRLSYRELRHEVRRLAKGLHALGVRRGRQGRPAQWATGPSGSSRISRLPSSAAPWSPSTPGRRRASSPHVLSHSDNQVPHHGRSLPQVRLPGDPRLPPAQRAMRWPACRRSCASAARPDHPARRFETLWELAETVDDATIDSAQRRRARRGRCLPALHLGHHGAAPRGVQLQHYALIENMWNIGERLHLRAGDRLWLAVSLFWGLGCENALFRRDDPRRLHRAAGALRRRPRAAPDRGPSAALSSTVRPTWCTRWSSTRSG